MSFDLTKASELANTAVFLKNDFLNTANWRREEAVEHPDDKRNLEAVELLERLAGTVDQVEPDLLEAYVGSDFSVDTHSEMLRTIGFQWAPKTATEYLQEFIATMISEN